MTPETLLSEIEAGGFRGSMVPVGRLEDLRSEIEIRRREIGFAPDRCEKCAVCVNACPTGAIDPDRFIIRADRCITFMNERTGEFPAWLDPASHQCLVGCMRCQEACPENMNFRNWIVRKGSFTEEETGLLLSGKQPSGETVEKLEALSLTEYLPVLPRNLKILLGANGT